MDWTYLVEGYNHLWEIRGMSNILFIKMKRLSKKYLYSQLYASDRRSDDFPLMSSFLPTLFLCLAYVMIVKVWGPNYMKDRPPYKLYWVLVAYNLVQIYISSYLFYEVSILKKILTFLFSLF